MTRTRDPAAPICAISVAAAVLLSLACAGGDRSDAPPSGPTTPPTDTTGTVQRGALTVAVTIDAADAAVAAALGLVPAAPAGLTVTLIALDDATVPPAVATTDAAGRVTFTRLLEGAYSVAVERPLTDAERQALPLADQEVGSFAGGASLTLAPGPQTTTITAVAGRPGSLVISEIWPYTGPPVARSNSQFVELYNNGDTTVFLDGMLFGAIPFASYNGSSGGGSSYDYCRVFEALRRDSTQLPLRVAQVFPGSGREYPLAPGDAVVLAMDAIDHRPFAPGTLDLSAADFESIGDTRDVDNPAVPNLGWLPGRSLLGPEGRGFFFGYVLLPDAYVLAAAPRAPLATATADTAFAAFTNLPLIARADVLDVVFAALSAEARAFLETVGFRTQDCAVPWHPSWDRAPARLVHPNRYEEDRAAFVRRVAFTRPDGRVVLQRTRTSARDWVYGPLPTPGVVR